MRINQLLKSRLLILGLALACTLGTGQVEAAKIHAQKGRIYRLSKQHGPWLIMVAVFSEPPEERRSEKGMTPKQAANQMVYELRKRGLPAYTFEPHEASEKIQVVKSSDEAARSNSMMHLVGENSICVLAGNYDIINNPKDKAKAERALAQVKVFEPPFLSKETVEGSVPINSNLSSTNPRKYGVFQKLKSGAVFASTPWTPKPLSGAFLTVNPLRSPEELNQSKRNKVLLDYNEGKEFSLVDNPGKYTLVVATFHGNSKTQALNTNGLFNRQKASTVSSSLDEAGYKAWEFCKALRTAKAYGYDKNYEAYVFHNRYKSFVAIGSFDSPNDPEIERLKKMMSAKVKQTAGGRGQNLFAEMFSIPRNPGPGRSPEKSWIFDPEPRLSVVPKLK